MRNSVSDLPFIPTLQLLPFCFQQQQVTEVYSRHPGSQQYRDACPSLFFLIKSSDSKSSDSVFTLCKLKSQQSHRTWYNFTLQMLRGRRTKTKCLWELPEELANDPHRAARKRTEFVLTPVSIWRLMFSCKSLSSYLLCTMVATHRECAFMAFPTNRGGISHFAVKYSSLSCILYLFSLLQRLFHE